MGAALDTISYGYGDSSWKDLLTSYDGKQLSSDAIGNLSGDGKWSYSWRRGRVLWDMSRMVDEDAELFEAVQYRYDSNGRRIGKAYGDSYNFRIAGGQLYYIGDSTGTSYYYAGDDLSQINITFPDNSSTSLHFTYDEIGPMSVTYDGAEYFYLKNAQGDVTGLVNSSGTQVVAYTYDAWGNPLTTTGTMADTLGKLNPFRYRGYVYDAETGLYYLQSRYYNPETGRFINADSGISGVGGELIGNNMFSYCFNNPVNKIDSSGNWPKLSTILTGIAVVAVAVAAVAVAVVAAPVIAGVGIASGITASAASIATAAICVAGVSGTAALVTKTIENTASKDKYRDQSVYVMRDSTTNDVQYVGITNNPVRRQREHDRDKRKEHLKPLEVKFTGLTKVEARIMEQLLISAYTMQNLDNARREIAVGNISGFAGSMNNIINIFSGAAESELLSLMER